MFLLSFVFCLPYPLLHLCSLPTPFKSYFFSRSFHRASFTHSMARLSWASAASLVLLLWGVWSQQLQGSYRYISYPQLSQSCQNALNTTVTCPLALAPLAISGGIIDGNGTAALCVASCYSSLMSARTTIAGACKGSNDSIVYKTVAYPGMYEVQSSN